MLLVILFSLIGGLASLLAVSLLIKSKNLAHSLAIYATPFAAGVLLASAFTNLLPEALHDGDSQAILTTALCGLLAFFILERFLRFFHHHHEDESKHGKISTPLVVIGDTLHNALDGVALGAAFLISPTTGIIAALAIAAHEIPQEIGDFGILLKNGMGRMKVVWVNALSAVATVVTATVTYAIGDESNAFIPYILALTAGFFIYIAASDIIPEIHDSLQKGQRDIRPWLLLLGAALVMIISPIAHDYIEPEAASHHAETHNDCDDHDEHEADADCDDH